MKVLLGYVALCLHSRVKLVCINVQSIKLQQSALIGIFCPIFTSDTCHTTHPHVSTNSFVKSSTLVTQCRTAAKKNSPIVIPAKRRSQCKTGAHTRHTKSTTLMCCEFMIISNTFENCGEYTPYTGAAWPPNLPRSMDFREPISHALLQQLWKQTKTEYNESPPPVTTHSTPMFFACHLGQKNQRIPRTTLVLHLETERANMTLR